MPKPAAQLKVWTGKFGKDYTKRSIISTGELENFYKGRYGMTAGALNKLFLDRISRSIRILEVGCNAGNQLLCLQKMGFRNLYGIEPQEAALKLAGERTKGVNIVKGDAFDIPFADKSFDLVFTAGVLIHISPKDIKKAVREIHRCSRRYIWGLEYYSEKYEEIPYRGKKKLLWKADFPRLYLELFDDLQLVKKKPLKYSDNPKNIDVMFLLEKKDK